MKISKYTKLISKDSKFFIYNSFTNYFGEINKELYDFLEKKQKDGSNVVETVENDKLWKKLHEKRVIIDSEDEDFLSFQSIIEQQRKWDNYLVLTIAPTMDCNFSCPYCFEDKKKGYMSDKTVQQIINFINKHNNLDALNLTWFGGEPLLAPHIIEDISNKIDKQKFTNINASIITNGYFLTKENLDLLVRCNIRSIQISIDGMPETHNKKKYTATDKNTFETIIRNIDCINAMSGIQLCVRVNIDKENENDFLKVYDFFKNRYNNNSVFVAPAFIIQTTKESDANPRLFNNNIDKFAFLKKISLHTCNSRLIYPCESIIECAVRNRNSWVFDAEGNVYKCWEIIGNQEYKVGKIGEGGEISITNHTLLDNYLYGADPLEDITCRNCFSLPVCKGGCPHKRIENKFNNKKFYNCTTWHNQWENYLLLRYELEQGSIKQ
ncbi:MAG TPA: SPASM domain-containing protein [Bacteroidales bacterium]|nr:SPASM domain-containing protein [Bacteroidales bacterium]HOR82632.1 SPASM domain-containing protein [Bacteroidales bacterium]HPJ91823.1 SPASM domain-containing protein [Bacteroidales bacterium]